jgi:hypothetical protein
LRISTEHDGLGRAGLAKAWGVGVLPTTFVLVRRRVAQLFVEGDVDWTRPDILAALDGVARPE